VLWALDLAHDDRGAAAHGDAVRLVTRDDGGDRARLRSSLEEVAGEGASIIVTALDAETAKEALAWGAASSVSVITLATPPEPVAGSVAPGFTVGEDWQAEIGILVAALSGLPGSSETRPAPPIATLADSEATVSLADSLAEKAPSHGSAPVACDTAFTTAGESRFPFATWERGGVSRWIVAGSPTCADDLLSGLAGRGRGGSVALALEASETTARAKPGTRLVSVSAGVVPLAAAPSKDPRTADVREMVARTGAPARWWTALGRDATVLARRALASLPTDTTENPAEIARRRALVQKSLHDTTATLWTSDHQGFGADGVLPRTFRIVDLGR
jgi:hypothetical protein